MARTERTRHPGIYRKGSRYVVVWRHRGHQHKKSVRTLAEAREFQATTRAIDSRPVSRVAFGDFAREWIERYQGRTSRGFRDSTRTDYRGVLELYAIPWFDKRGLRLPDVEPRDVAEFVAWLADPIQHGGRRLSPSRIRNIIAPIRAMFATAVEEGAVRSNPALRVRLPAPVEDRDDHEDHDRDVKALTRAELRGLLAETPEHWQLLVEFLAHTGLRFSEAAGLRWRDLQLDNGRPCVRVRWQVYRGQTARPKSRYGQRDVPLSPGTARALWATRAREGQGPDELVFVTPTGKPLRYSNVLRRVLKPAGVRAGLPWVGFHTLRHTCASLLFDAGRNAKQVQVWLGHSDPGFTLRTYVHLLDAGVGDARFMDDATAPRGNMRATEHPGTAAKLADRRPTEIPP